MFYLLWSSFNFSSSPPTPVPGQLCPAEGARSRSWASVLAAILPYTEATIVAEKVCPQLPPSLACFHFFRFPLLPCSSLQ